MLVLFLLQIIVFCHNAFCFLDIEELKSVNYGIDVLANPVVLGEDSPAGAVYLSSVHGQQYQCSYEDRSLEERREKEEEKVAIETGIPELLKPMEDSPCIVYTRGWWTYEFCYGKNIKQYHVDDGKILGKTVFLGYYESELDWKDKDGPMSRRSRLNRYHTQQYVNGSVCDLTEKPRRTEVRFLCEEGQGDFIARVDEPESCVYIITVHTTKICHHPYLKPPTPNMPVAITCNPLLTQEEYDEYTAKVKAEEEERAAAILAYKEQRLKMAALEESHDDLDEDLQYPSDLDDTTAGETDKDSASSSADLDKETEKLLQETSEKLGKLFMDSLLKGLSEAATGDGEGDTEEERLQNTLNKMLSQTPKKSSDPSDEDEDEDDDEDDEIEEDTMPEGELSEEGDGGEELEDDGEEGEEEEEDEGLVETEDDESGLENMDEEDEDEELMEEFEEGLNKVARTPEERAKLANYKDNIKSVMQSQFQDIVDEAQNEVGEGGDAVDPKVAFENLAQTLAKLLANIEKDGEEEDQDKETQDDREDEEEEEDTETEEDNALQEAELEKFISKTIGRQVQVKIVTTGYYDPEDGSAQMLSEEDSQAFNKMVITILGGDDGEAKELERQTLNEAGYNFNYGDKQSKNKKSSLDRTP